MNDQTAYDSFVAAQATGTELPATVPVEDDYLHAGIATATFDVTQKAEVLAGVTSACWRERAVMAIYACRATRLGIDAEHPELHSA
jgi:hypothetical protein